MNQTTNEPQVDSLPQQLESIGPSRLQRLLEISTTLTSTLDLRQLLDMVIDTANDLAETDYASILLIDGGSGELYFAASNGVSYVDEYAVVALDGSVAGKVVRSGKPLIISDVQREALEYAEIKAAHYVTRNMLSVPLRTKGHVIGVLEAINKRGGGDYSRQDVALLQVLASQAAVAIQNARLFQQTDFIAEFLHELKTPLMALTAASELLAREDTAGRRLELVGMIQRETSRLSKMAQDFLDLARLESGRIQINREPVDLAALIHNVVRLQEPQAIAREIDIHVELPDRVPPIMGDDNRLMQVLLNLLNNAIKYNVVHGSATIKLKELEKEVMIEIADTGAGIAPENLAHLFERFYRIPDREGFTKGTGLGLSIAARILQEHGGRIEVESTLGQGSTFRCYLPTGGPPEQRDTGR